jgi:hypothetical protein
MPLETNLFTLVLRYFPDKTEAIAGFTGNVTLSEHFAANTSHLQVPPLEFLKALHLWAKEPSLAHPPLMVTHPLHSCAFFLLEQSKEPILPHTFVLQFQWQSLLLHDFEYL